MGLLMHTPPKFLRGSLAASLVIIAPLTILGLVAVLTGSSVLTSGEIDNDPMRAGGVLLYISPVLYICMTVVFYCLTRLLSFFGGLKFSYLVLLAACASLAFAWQIAYDSLLVFCVLAVIHFGLLTLGLFTWFKCA
jgi:hypothetical protein